MLGYNFEVTGLSLNTTAPRLRTQPEGLTTRKDKFPMATRKLPTTEDSQQIISGILKMDRSIRRFSRLILQQQDRLRALVSARAWRVYLSIEELSNARLVRVADRLVRPPRH